MKALKTRYVAHYNKNGEVQYWTAERKVLFLWLSYAEYTTNGLEDIKFNSVIDVKIFINDKHVDHKKGQDAKTTSTSKITYP